MKTYFVKRGGTHPAFCMRGFQMRDAFLDLGVVAECIRADLVLKELPASEEAICFIIVKPRCGTSYIQQVKEKFPNSKIIIDFVDMIEEKHVKPYLLCDQVDLYIIPTELSLKEYERYCSLDGKNTHVLYHHCTPLTIPSHKPKFSNKTDMFSSVYFGELRKDISLFNVLDIPQFRVDFRGRNLWKMYPYHCQVAYRTCSPFKPNTKIAFAASCDSNIVVNKSNGGVYTIPEEYTYVCEDNTDSFIETYERAKSGFGGKQWNANREIMKWYKEEYSLENIAKQFHQKIEEL